MNSISEVILMFFVYGFLGWCLEVAYHVLTTGKFINRGFLNGPICPIYGTGATIVIICLIPLESHFFALYFASVVITTVLEFVTGTVLEKIYHIRWWDYSNQPFNLNGQICLKFSLAWGLACVALMYGINPFVMGLIIHLPKFIIFLLNIALSVMLVADLAATIIAIKNLNVRIAKLNDISHKIRELSDDIGEHVYDVTKDAIDKFDEFKDSEEAKELHEKYIKLVGDVNILQKRIIKTLPKAQFNEKRDIINMLKEKHKKLQKTIDKR